MPYAAHAYNVYAIRSQQRDIIRDALRAAGVETAVHYPEPVHLQPAYADLGYGSGTFEQAERAAREVLSLPIYPELSEDRQLTVVNAVRQAAGAAGS